MAEEEEAHIVLISAPAAEPQGTKIKAATSISPAPGQQLLGTWGHGGDMASMRVAGCATPAELLTAASAIAPAHPAKSTFITGARWVAGHRAPLCRRCSQHHEE